MGSTSTTTIRLTREQLEGEIAQHIDDIVFITDYLTGNGGTEDKSELGPTKIAEKFYDLCQDLASVNFEYEIEEEDGLAINIEPNLTLALVIEIEAGITVDIEKSVTFTKEKGIIAGVFGEEMPFDKV